MPTCKARTADIEQRLLIDAIYHRYHYDFRGYARVVKRRLASALVQFDCKDAVAAAGPRAAQPAVFPCAAQYLTVR